MLDKQRQNDIEIIVNSILNSIGLSYPEDRLENIIKAYSNVRVVEADFGVHRLDASGAISYSNTVPTIYINRDISPARKTFTLAHEFGHFVLHRGNNAFRLDFNTYDGSQEAMQETEANYFAAVLLMPKETFIKVYQFFNDENKVADYFGVSTQAIRTRLSWLKAN